MEDPVASLASRDPSVDPDAASHKRLLVGWRDAEGVIPGMTAKQAVEAAGREANSLLRDAVLEIAASRSGDGSSATGTPVSKTLLQPYRLRGSVP